MANLSVVAARIEANLKARYRQVPRDDNEKFIDAILKFWVLIQEGKMSSKSMLQEVTGIIHRMLMFQEIAIVLRDPVDGLFRYNAFVGFTREAEEDMRSLVFSEAEVKAFDRLPGVRVTKLIEFTISEVAPKAGDEAQFNRPTMVAMPRKTDDEFTSGDYMTVLISGKDDEPLGFIEVSGPRDGKIPTGCRMKSLELLATMTGIAIECQKETRPKPRGDQQPLEMM